MSKNDDGVGSRVSVSLSCRGIVGCYYDYRNHQNRLASVPGSSSLVGHISGSSSLALARVAWHVKTSSPAHLSGCRHWLHHRMQALTFLALNASSDAACKAGWHPKTMRRPLKQSHAGQHERASKQHVWENL